MLSGIAGSKCKMVKIAGQHSQALFTGPRKQPSWHAICAKMVEKITLRPLQKL
jgi:hypothetical protein